MKSPECCAVLKAESSSIMAAFNVRLLTNISDWGSSKLSQCKLDLGKLDLDRHGRVNSVRTFVWERTTQSKSK